MASDSGCGIIAVRNVRELYKMSFFSDGDGQEHFVLIFFPFNFPFNISYFTLDTEVKKKKKRHLFFKI